MRSRIEMGARRCREERKAAGLISILRYRCTWGDNPGVQYQRMRKATPGAQGTTLGVSTPWEKQQKIMERLRKMRSGCGLVPVRPWLGRCGVWLGGSSGLVLFWPTTLSLPSPSGSVTVPGRPRRRDEPGLHVGFRKRGASASGC